MSHHGAALTVGAVLLALLSASPSPALAREDGLQVGDSSGTALAAPSYRIGKEDVLRIDVYGEPALSADRIPVRPDGKISLPMVGDVQAAGVTPESLGSQLTELFSRHLVAPVVTVIVVEINSFKAYIMGNVKMPGELIFGKETTLLQALALAGGFTEFANTKRILVIREEGGRQTPISINYERIISGENMEMNLWLKPGDTIVVP